LIVSITLNNAYIRILNIDVYVSNERLHAHTSFRRF
jgi:hypothetical protein